MKLNYLLFRNKTSKKEAMFMHVFLEKSLKISLDYQLVCFTNTDNIRIVVSI